MGSLRAPVSLFLLALVLRLLMTWLAGAYTGMTRANLALLYDGHIYLLISRSFPHPYQGIHEFFPVFRDSTYFTGWFPAYPATVWMFDMVLRETRVAALTASVLAGSLAVALFYRLASRVSSRPLEAALVFSIFPATWLLVGGLSFVEPLYLCLLIAAFDCALQGRVPAAVLLGGLAAVTQKSGFLVLPILAAAAWLRDAHGRREAPYYALCLVPLAGLAVYFAVLFRDPLMLTRVQGEVYAGSVWAPPFWSVFRGLVDPVQMFRGDFWLRKALIASSVLFYTVVFVWAWRRRDYVSRPLLAWLGVVLTFVVCLGRPSYEPFARYMLPAAPPAILLAVEWARPRLGPAFLAAWLLTAAATLTIGARDVSGAAELLLRVWPQGYFDVLVERLVFGR